MHLYDIPFAVNKEEKSVPAKVQKKKKMGKLMFKNYFNPLPSSQYNRV